MATSLERDAGARVGVHAADDHLDVVLVDRLGRVQAVTRSRRTSNLNKDLVAALKKLSAIERDFDFRRVSAVTLTGQDPTTSAVGSRRLCRVASLRIGAPLTSAIPPLATWARPLRAAVDAGSAIVAGGWEFSGARVAPLDQAAIVDFAFAAAQYADSVAITSIFSPVDPSDEITAAQIVASVAGSIPITLSHEISTLGLVERENATIMNAALRQWAGRPSRQFSTAVAESEFAHADCYFTQNDGTQRLAEYAERFPVFQIGSGIADALRGAAHLSGLNNANLAQVADGSITFARLVNGFPRESIQRQLVEGVVTRFRAPETMCVTVPQEPGTTRAALMHISHRTDDLPLLVVGPEEDDEPIGFDGVGPVIRPPHGGVANAVGAAVAPVAGSAERIYNGRPGSVGPEIDALTSDARNRAILAGASPDALRVVDVEEIPLTYLGTPAVHVRVRVAGIPMT
ncbi:hypothetical protein RD149_23600 [Gordonia westfalica]|uniref:Hydantoinase/oxoprolinase n=1 Tax=Gordonia westfalica TaxID=158898 RepID=A0ABU2GZ43_9ACTN|nr:hypothetical protein [Gordonia westfalica]MDS1116732.1 hypothetical protein [Gordonia westfalica]